MEIQVGYDLWAATYDTDRNLTRDLDRTVTRGVLEEIRCRAALEIGCGTGKNTALLVDIADHVYALDFSERMLAKARGNISAPNVTFLQADIRQPWQVPSETMDLVLCNLVLEHIAELRLPFSEAHRVLHRNQWLFISELHPFRQYLGVQARFEHGTTETKIPAFTHHIHEYLHIAEEQGFRLARFDEWWHREDKEKPPRLASFLFQKSTRD